MEYGRGRGRGGGGGGRGRGGRGRGYGQTFSRSDLHTASNSGDTSSYSAYQPNSQNSRTIKVPTTCVGKIIGRAGAKIKELQSNSNTRINIIKQAVGEETEITITGNDSDINNAEAMILDVVSGGNDYRSNGGGGSDFRSSGGNNYRSSGNNDYRSGTNNDYRSNTSTGNDWSNSGNDWSNSSNDWSNSAGTNFKSNENTYQHQSHYNNKPVNTFEPVSVENLPSIDFSVCEKHEEEFWAKFPPVKKYFYEELPEVRDMSDEDVLELRESLNKIVVARPLNEAENKKILNPVTTFQQAFHNFPGILEVIEKAGFTKPTPIQCQAWPIILSGEDMIGIAQTGTGKTLAFLLPALIHIENQTIPREERGGATVLVLAPTRELALQIESEVGKYNYKDIRSVCIYGGADRKAQLEILRQGVEIIIATPGRLDDFMQSGDIIPESITYVVLDEADRMLDMGFEPQIRKALYKVRPTRQTIMTSATWPSGVKRLAISYTVNPVQVYVGSLDLTAVHSVKQTLIFVEDNEDVKFQILTDFIKSLNENDKVIVFCGKKARASFITVELNCMGLECTSIHSDLEQYDREQAIQDMKDGTSRILIGTDLVSRGIDIQDITHVVNYDFPRQMEEYVHRVGRTGRAGRMGESISYFTKWDSKHARQLIEILNEAQQEIPPMLESMAEQWEERKKRDDMYRSGSGYKRGQNFNRYR